MPSKFTNTRAVERPTLPSIHTLDLPMLATSNVKYAPHDNAVCLQRSLIIVHQPDALFSAARLLINFS